MNKFDDMPKELVNNLRKIYMYYGKTFPAIYDADNIFSDDWPFDNEECNHWWEKLHYIHDKANGTGTCMAFDYDGHMNTFKDEFIEWIMNGTKNQKESG